MLADRWAAFTYGGGAFERGLRHVIERSIHFDAFVNVALNEVVHKKQPLANLYAYRPSSQLDTASIDYEVEEAFRREASPYDSHPCPADRIRWAQAIGAGKVLSPDDESDAWTLFASREEVERRLTGQVRQNLATQGIVVLEQAPAAG